MRLFTPLSRAVLLAMACSYQAQAMTLTEAIQSTIATHPEHDPPGNPLEP